MSLELETNAGLVSEIGDAEKSSSYDKKPGGPVNLLDHGNQFQSLPIGEKRFSQFFEQLPPVLTVPDCISSVAHTTFQPESPPEHFINRIRSLSARYPEVRCAAAISALNRSYARLEETLPQFCTRRHDLIIDRPQLGSNLKSVIFDNIARSKFSFDSERAAAIPEKIAWPRLLTETYSVQKKRSNYLDAESNETRHIPSNYEACRKQIALQTWKTPSPVGTAARLYTRGTLNQNGFGQDYSNRDHSGVRHHYERHSGKNQASPDCLSKDYSSENHPNNDRLNRDQLSGNHLSEDHLNKVHPNRDPSRENHLTEHHSSEHHSSGHHLNRDHSSKDHSSEDNYTRDHSNKNHSSEDHLVRDHSSTDYSSKDHQSAKDDLGSPSTHILSPSTGNTFRTNLDESCRNRIAESLPEDHLGRNDRELGYSEEVDLRRDYDFPNQILWSPRDTHLISPRPAWKKSPQAQNTSSASNGTILHPKTFNNGNFSSALQQSLSDTHYDPAYNEHHHSVALPHTREFAFSVPDKKPAYTNHKAAGTLHRKGKKSQDKNISERFWPQRRFYYPDAETLYNRYLNEATAYLVSNYSSPAINLIL